MGGKLGDDDVGELTLFCEPAHLSQYRILRRDHRTTRKASSSEIMPRMALTFRLEDAQFRHGAVVQENLNFGHGVRTAD
jgi:hypothetical protein